MNEDRVYSLKDDYIARVCSCCRKNNECSHNYFIIKQVQYKSGDYENESISIKCPYYDFIYKEKGAIKNETKYIRENN